MQKGKIYDNTDFLLTSTLNLPSLERSSCRKQVLGATYNILVCNTSLFRFSQAKQEQAAQNWVIRHLLLDFGNLKWLHSSSPTIQ